MIFTDRGGRILKPKPLNVQSLHPSVLKEKAKGRKLGS